MRRAYSNFQREMDEHLIKFKEENQYLPSTNKKKSWQYANFEDNLYPPIKHGFLQYAYDNAVPLHDYINHVRSSQAYAINIFYPLLKNEPETLLDLFGKKIGTDLSKIINYNYEYTVNENLLGEWKSDTRPDEYVTACDLLILCEDLLGKKHGFVIEVKFTELQFNQCGGAASKSNKDNHVCESKKTLFEDPKKCYLHLRTRGKAARKYFDYFEDLNKSFPNLAENNCCPFKANNQCIRNHALARALKTSNVADYTYFVLVYHDNNDSIISYWNSYINSVASEIKKELFSLKVSDIIKMSSNITYKKYFHDRYKIVQEEENTRATTNNSQ